MVLPLIPIAIAGLASGGGFGLGTWLSRGKKGTTEIHAEQEHYAPTITTTEAFAHYHPRLQFAPVSTYAYQGPTYIIDSPGAVSKKEQILDIVSKPIAEFGAIEYPMDIAGSERRGEGGEGVNMTHIAIIAVVGAVGIMALKGRKKK
ncbi:unnamed protein product [marine sediment metagenome]|uniref:Uncharacterized protein n=1 Tax=marine sediment metagenome TaxID=412755 RepID=X1FW48_9ZZZZ